MPTRPSIHRTATSKAPMHHPENYERNNAFYDTRPWRRLRIQTLRARPICEHCQTEPAHHVHHVVHVCDDWGLRLTPSNLKSLCASCHSRHHARR
jgi:5-methylcytosine-specific restriction protein A